MGDGYKLNAGELMLISLGLGHLKDKVNAGLATDYWHKRQNPAGEEFANIVDALSIKIAEAVDFNDPEFTKTVTLLTDAIFANR